MRGAIDLAREHIDGVPFRQKGFSEGDERVGGLEQIGAKTDDRNRFQHGFENELPLAADAVERPADVQRPPADSMCRIQRSDLQGCSVVPTLSIPDGRAGALVPPQVLPFANAQQRPDSQRRVAGNLDAQIGVSPLHVPREVGEIRVDVGRGAADVEWCFGVRKERHVERRVSWKKRVGLDEPTSGRPCGVWFSLLFSLTNGTGSTVGRSPTTPRF
jgi:hypothetical protein